MPAAVQNPIPQSLRPYGGSQSDPLTLQLARRALTAMGWNDPRSLPITLTAGMPTPAVEAPPGVFGQAIQVLMDRFGPDWLSALKSAVKSGATPDYIASLAGK